MYKTVSSILERIGGWCAEPPVKPPLVVLNKHCPYCPFEKVCRQQAEESDDLSLLDRMSPKAIPRYRSKGIFTVKQLSFLFKPRRRRRRKTPARGSIPPALLLAREDTVQAKRPCCLRQEGLRGLDNSP
jgi:hypothetical protein